MKKLINTTRLAPIALSAAVVVLLAAAPTAQAANYWWNGTGTTDWNTAANWDTPAWGSPTHAVPTDSDTANIPTASGPTLGAGSDAVCGNFITRNAGSLTTVSGGSIAGGDAGPAGGYYLAIQQGTVDINAGSITFTLGVHVGYTATGNGTLNVTGGEVYSGWGGYGFREYMRIGNDSGGVGVVNLGGDGTIYVDSQFADARLIMSPTGLLDITTGTMILAGDWTGTGQYDIPTYVADGLITAYGGTGTVLVEHVTGGDYTQVTAMAIPEPATVALFAVGGGLALLRRRTR